MGNMVTGQVWQRGTGNTWRVTVPDNDWRAYPDAIAAAANTADTCNALHPWDTWQAWPDRGRVVIRVVDAWDRNVTHVYVAAFPIDATRAAWAPA